MNSILITGGCGFIGSNIINTFLKKYRTIKIVNVDKLYFCASLKNIDNSCVSLIDDNFDNYIGSKNELLYLVSILSLKDDSNYKNNSELLILYDNLISNEKISFEIKERVKKIHEFYIFI